MASSSDVAYRHKLYEKYFSHQVKRADAENLAAQLAAEFPQLKADLQAWLPASLNSRILDIGCGYGNALLWLQEQGYTHLSGIDLSPEQVATAQSLGLSDVQCAGAFTYLAELPPDARFDFILLFDVIEHLSKSELLQLLQSIRARLSPQGRAIFRTPNMDAPLTSVYAYGDYTHETLLNSRSAAQLASSAGFGSVQVVESPLVVRGWLKSLGQSLSFVLLRVVLRWVLFATARSSKGVLLTPNMLIVVAH
ncbi:MAG: class I SAM-dependent methyltransferase [Chitinophagales bacterium]|nr:class I SAM-dependent methyltransferase [Chitinophagales bacterium]